MSTIHISDEVRRNFHLFWDNFPFPVMLTHKNRTILEVNTVCAELGLAPGNRCVDIGKKEFHSGCLAGQALQEQTAKRIVAYVEYQGKVLDSYWVPLAGEPDVFLHFSIDISDYAAERMFPQKGCEAGAECSSCGGH